MLVTKEWESVTAEQLCNCFSRSIAFHHLYNTEAMLCTLTIVFITGSVIHCSTLFHVYFHTLHESETSPWIS